jgi:uncharacterized membrane protein YdbT with pleckstrin-like domain
VSGGWSLEPGERMRLERRPDAADVPVSALGFAAIALAVGVPVWWLAGLPGLRGLSLDRGAVTALVLVALGLRLAWGELERRCRRFALTDRRIMARFGVFQRHVTSIRLDRVQHVVLARRFRDRLVGIGTVGVATAGTGSIELAWIGVREPAAVLAAIEQAVREAEAEAQAKAGAGDGRGGPGRRLG